MALTVKVFESAMCCSTGMCGPVVDETIVNFNGLIERLKAEGHDVQRYMITQNLAAFQQDEQVMSILKDEQLDALPITTVNGKVVKKGAYPEWGDIGSATA